MQSSYSLDATGHTLRIYGRHKIKYEASCQIIPTAPGKAFIHTLNGLDFYAHLCRLKFAPFRELGITIIEAVVSPGHVVLLGKLLAGIASVTVVRPVLYKGKHLREIQIVDLAIDAA